MSDQPESAALVAMLEQQRDDVREMYFGLLEDQMMIVRQRDELLDFLIQLHVMACDGQFGSLDFRAKCSHDIPKAIAAARGNLP